MRLGCLLPASRIEARGVRWKPFAGTNSASQAEVEETSGCFFLQANLPASNPRFPVSAGICNQGNDQLPEVERFQGNILKEQLLFLVRYSRPDQPDQSSAVVAKPCRCADLSDAAKIPSAFCSFLALYRASPAL